MKCLLTGTEGKGVKAHIIPRSFYDLDYSQPVTLEIITNSEKGYNGKSFAGIYDSNIVTVEGERIFSGWDSYAHDLLIRDRESFTKRVSEGKVIALETPRYDYAKLKLFFLSVLWRASVSTRPFFQHVRLGHHEAIVKDALLNANPGDRDFYSVALACFTDLPSKTAMLDPFKERYGYGITYYRFFLGHYIAYIKVDQQPTPQVFTPTELRPDSPLIIVSREFHQSKEKVVMRKLVIA